MVGGTTHNQHPSLQLAPPSSASTTSPEEDEIVKRNTDCVYFLASPLTCKKGSECEYRHSDVARVNPRDCFYWLNGNCLNPKCAFRHPPLDGLIGADVATPVGPSKPGTHPASYAAPKQGVACIFFQKGFCLKGHLCPFVHGPPNSINNKPPTIPNPPKTVFPVPEKPVHEQKSAQTIQTTPFSARNGNVDKKVALPAPRVGPPSSNPSHSSVDHGYRVSETDRTVNAVNAKDADGYSREPSPGFDVLVDNEVEDSEYPREKDEFRISRRGHDYDDYGVDRDMYREHRDYDHFREREDHVDRLERRPYSRNDRENESDLRHRISKQRRGFGSGSSSDNGLRSIISREYGRESHVSRHHRSDHRHEHRQDHRQDQGLSSRLRGRINIPRRSISPGRPLSHIQTRLKDRITGYRDITSDTDSIFSGPKRHQSNDEQFLGKRKYTTKTEDGLSFEGPKPLSEILKRKRGANSNNNNNDIHDEKNEKSKPADGNSVNNGNGEVEIEDALIDEELEGYDDENKDGEYEYEYEQIEGEEGEYNLDEGEFVEEDEEDGYGGKDSVVYA